jgi:hypothetical protein
MEEQKLSYYQRNRDKILEKRRMQREQKRRFLLNTQLEHIILNAEAVPMPVADPVADEFTERTEHNGIEPVMEPVMEPVVEQVIDKVIEVDEVVVKKTKKTKKPKTI